MSLKKICENQNIICNIVEGLVITEDFYCFSHVWNEWDDSYFDVTFDLLGSEKVQNTLKKYYVVKIIEDDLSIHHTFFKDTDPLLELFYSKYPCKKEFYLEQKKLL